MQPPHVHEQQGEQLEELGGTLRAGSNRNVWNAPSWPYETSRVLTGMANILHGNFSGMAAGAPTAGIVTRGRYWDLLLQFARQHTRTFAVNDTAKPPGSGHIFENLHPTDGYWNTRQWRWEAHMGEALVNKGKDYFHSSFIDLVISGLLGFRATRGPASSVVIDVSPIFPPAMLAATSTTAAALPWFALDGVRCAGHDVALVFDRDGSRYGKGKGFMLFVDGKVAASRCDVGPLKVEVSGGRGLAHLR